MLGPGGVFAERDGLVVARPDQIEPGDVVVCPDGRRVLVDRVESRRDPITGGRCYVVSDGGVWPAVFYPGEKVRVAPGRGRRPSRPDPAVRGE